eukprot:1464884-Rhodomonas_salina.5
MKSASATAVTATSSPERYGSPSAASRFHVSRVHFWPFLVASTYRHASSPLLTSACPSAASREPVRVYGGLVFDWEFERVVRGVEWQ